MKNTFNKISLFLVSILIISCGMGNSPKKTADKFLTSFNNRDFEEARKYATPETNKLVDLMENLTKMAQPVDSALGKKIELLDEKVEGDVAYVTFQEEGADQPETLKLKKIDGKWLVHVTKEDIAAKDMNMGTSDAEEGMMLTPDSLEAASDSTAIFSQPE
ncbi:MAG TPA: DUF4878 domain-containing protein [Bacteroidia bacterium]|nr:DUF4878 domain-containing protein [Bacteroidia bacterium]